MMLRFHRAVQRDIDEVLDYYAERSLTAADRFWEDLQERFREIAGNPGQFGFIHKDCGLRRVRLRKFPYLIVNNQSRDLDKITSDKHEKRHPLAGLRRR